MDRIIFTHHARKQMVDRDITLSDVERIATTPDVTYTGQDGKLNLVGVLSDDRRVRLVMVGPKVITIMWQF